MSTEVLLSVPAEVAAQVIAQANDSGRSFADTLRSVLTSHQIPPTMMEDWSDESVLAAADMMMPQVEDARQSALLQLRKTRDLTDQEQIELNNLHEMYTAGNLHKARGMLEAAWRGLRTPPVL